MTSPITDSVWAARGPSIFSAPKNPKDNGAAVAATLARKREAPASAKELAALRERV